MTESQARELVEKVVPYPSWTNAIESLAQLLVQETAKAMKYGQEEAFDVCCDIVDKVPVEHIKQAILQARDKIT